MIGVVRCEDTDHDLLLCLPRLGDSFQHRQCHHGNNSALYGPEAATRSMTLMYALCQGFVVGFFGARRACRTMHTELQPSCTTLGGSGRTMILRKNVKACTSVSIRAGKMEINARR